jgi:pantoate--beta-alanine ligase
MRTIRAVAELRPVIFGHRREGRSIGLVPTMGAFHDGHLSLMHHAREQCDVVVVWLFVNPTQFNDASDLTGYPRDEARDAALAEEVGVDILFAPPVDEVYPAGFATTVAVGRLTETLEGAFRGRSHFDGVATVVTKMFNMVAPDVAYFGAKDAQQAVVVQQLVRDLDLPIRIELCETVREPDGLAMSSRNVHLSPEDRVRAAALSRALDAIDAGVAAGVLDADTLRARAAGELRSAGVEPEYLVIVAADTLAPVERVEAEVLALVAARIGTTRLIDNHRLMPARVTAGATGNGRQ